MKFLDLFAGIGGFRLGMEQAGHECVGYVEWDKFARKSYEAIHDTEGEWTRHDITTVSDNDFRLLRGQVDIICGGFPCQAFSVAGKRQGFEDTRGTLFFDVARAAQQIQPRFLFLENVKGLLSHDQGETFRIILNTLDELGYDAEWQVLNSKDFGVPQNRERVFIVGHLRGTSAREVFPIGEGFEIPGKSKTKGSLESEFIMSAITRKWASVHSGGESYLVTDKGVRFFTPRELWRAQGFPDLAFDKAEKVNSNAQLYYQAGNSVTVNVIYEIAKRLVK